jgi:hypothetical protein
MDDITNRRQDFLLFAFRFYLYSISLGESVTREVLSENCLGMNTQ